MSQLMVPNGWETVSLVGLVSIKHGFAFKSEHFRESGDYAVTTPGNFYEEGGFRDVGAKQRYYVNEFPASYLLRPGELIVAMTEQAEGLLGSAAIVPEDAKFLHNQRIGRVKCNSGSTRLDFLYWLFNSRGYRVAVRGTAAGTKVKHTSPSKLLSIPVPIPPVEEQERIADALNDVSSLCMSLERLIAKKQAIKQGMMQELLTGKTRLPGFVADWSETCLGDHVSYVKTIALSRAELDMESPLRYLHYGDIHTKTNVRIDAAFEEMPRVSASKVRNAGRLQVGDLVFADASEDPDGVGKSVEVTSVPIDGVVPGLHTIAARFDKSVLADGFKAYLQFVPDFRDALLRLASGTKVLATTRTYISSVVIWLPEVDEQRAIAAILRDSDIEIAAIEHQLLNVRNVKQGMMQELLGGRTRLVSAEVAV